MKKALYYLSSVFIIIVLVLFTPASWITKKVQEQLPQLSINSSSGYLWQGSAADVEFISRGYAIGLNTVAWRFDILSLLVLKPCLIFSIDSDNSQGQGKLCIYPFSQKIQFHHLDVKLSAVEIANLLGVEIQGEFHALIQTMVLNQQKLTDLQGDIIWQKAEFHNGEEWLNLGELLMAISSETQNNTIAINWLDMENRLQLNPIDIDVEMLFVNHQLSSVIGSISPRNAQHQSLLDTLELITQSQEDNKYFIERYFR